MRLPAQNLLFGISRRGTANSPKCFSTPLPFALHHLLINWVRFPCLSCLSTNSERKGEREREMCSGVSPSWEDNNSCFHLIPTTQCNAMQCAICNVQYQMCNVQCAKTNMQWQQQLLFSSSSHNQARLPAGCDPILVFIYF